MKQEDYSVDYPYIKLPVDCAIKQFKKSKKYIEKDLSSILSQIVILKNKDQSVENSQEELKALIDRLKDLKKKFFNIDFNKANSFYDDQDRLFQACQKRVKQVQNQNEGENNCQHKTRLNRLIIDYLLRNGYYQTAKEMIEQYKIDDLSELEIQLIMESNQIIQSLKNKKIELALQWCIENKSKLKQSGLDFEFCLHFQNFIELIKQEKRQEALIYIKKIEDVSKVQNFSQVKKAMICLIIKESKNQYETYNYLFHEDRWDDLIIKYKKANYQISSITTQSLLDLSIQAGLASLKTNYCFQAETQNQNCPVCDKDLQKIASKLPSTIKMISTLICRISGKVMDENNPPMMLPNGEVFSFQALQQMSSKNNGKVIDPINNKEFLFSDAVKIFLS